MYTFAQGMQEIKDLSIEAILRLVVCGLCQTCVHDVESHVGG